MGSDYHKNERAFRKCLQVNLKETLLIKLRSLEEVSLFCESFSGFVNAQYSHQVEFFFFSPRDQKQKNEIKEFLIIYNSDVVGSGCAIIGN